MDILQSIVLNNKLVAEALEKTVPAAGRLVEKIAARIGGGGKLFVLMGSSAVPAEYGLPEGTVVFLDGTQSPDYFTAAWKSMEEAGVSARDCVVAVDNETAVPYLMGGIRDSRRKGLLTACITAGTSSPLSQAAEISLMPDVDPVGESYRLKVRQLQQMALDMVLTALCSALGYPKDDAAIKKERSRADFMERAVATLMEELPQLTAAEAEELLLRHGSVKRAVAAQKGK